MEIRRKLIDEEYLKRYLIYALGEILFVVLGILFAVQLNSLNQNHSLRIKLILNQLMKDYPLWKDSKNLFKYGANHMTRGESFFTVYDVGNMVSNITKSNYQESFHIMIVGESGMTGSIFKSFPPSSVDSESGFYLSYLKPFFNITEGKEWYMFDLEPLRKMIERDKLKIDNINLIRAIKGYDILVIIPELTPAKLLGQQ